MDSDQFNYSNQTYKSFFGLYIAVLFFGIISTAVFYFLLYTLTGKQLVNEFFPTVERTSFLLEELNPSIEIYNFNQTNRITNASTSGFYSEDISILYIESSFNITKMVASSSAASQPSVKRKLFYENGIWYISDIFDDTFSILKNAYISEQFVNAILPEPKYLKEIVLDLMYSKSTVVLKRNNQIILTGIEVVSPWSRATTTAEISINPKNYKDFSISLNDSKMNSIIIKPISDSADFAPLPNIKNVQLNLFGDFLAKESVILRTNTEGIYDFLWHDWESSYFNCYRCVYKYADPDKDGISNAGEFVLGTDPKKITTQENLHVPNVVANIFTSKNFIRDPRGRTGLSVFSAQKPINQGLIIGVQFMYSYPIQKGKEGSYANLYIDDIFIDNIPRTQTEKPELIFMPVAQNSLATTATSSIIFVLNSLGTKGGELLNVKTDTFSWITKKSSSTI